MFVILVVNLGLILLFLYLVLFRVANLQKHGEEDWKRKVPEKEIHKTHLQQQPQKRLQKTNSNEENCRQALLLTLYFFNWLQKLKFEVWLHVDPNSDFSTFRHFFGCFSASFPPKFVSKFRGKTKTKLQKFAKSFFLSTYVPKLCQENAESLPSEKYLPKK